MLPNVVLIILVVESLLISLSTILLAQPKIFFGDQPSKGKKAAFWGGLFFLGVTFLWSIGVGMILGESRFHL